MTAGWVAATLRGQALARRLVGLEGARTLAIGDWPETRRALGTTVYGADLPAEADRPQARRVALEATTWQLRVLAGWLPPGQSALARLFAAPLEIANIENHLAALNGRPSGPSIQLGSLAAAWPRVAVTTTRDQFRSVLATSVWGDPGGTDTAAVALGLRLGWARRMATHIPAVLALPMGAVAVLVAREQFSFGRTINRPSRRVADRLIGRRWHDLPDIPTLVQQLPKSARWPLTGIEDPNDLWRAELAVVRRVSTDAERLVSSGHPNKATVSGAMALLLVDLWRLLAAIEVTGRSPASGEVFDDVA